MPPYCEKHNAYYADIDGSWQCLTCHAEKCRSVVDPRTVRQAGKVKLAEILKAPENIPVVIEHIESLRWIADIAHDLILDWRGDECLQDNTPAGVSDFIERLDEALVSIGYIDEQED